MGDLTRPRHSEAPRADGGKLVAPPAAMAGELIESNRRRLEACDYDVQGRTLAQLAADSRRELLAAALEYTRSYRDVNVAERNEARAEFPSLVLAGHQPELFHPGVWLKNFELDAIARANGAVAVNLVVDSDTIKASSLRVPSGSPAQPIVEAVLFDRPTRALPFEERRIADRALFESFAGRVTGKIAPLVKEPLVKDFWTDVVGRSSQTDRLGECLAQARHVWEGRWGTATLEVQQSRVCSLTAFYHFAAHLLAHLPRLWDIYNAALFEYRRANRIRSHAHPVPELAAEGDWLEAPFWVWRADDLTRRPLFVRSRDDQVVLADRAGWEHPLDLSADADLAPAIEQLRELARRGVRLRTRALVTTMLARVLLGDLFIHGIGGAKYDQMTDVLIERFFGLSPPEYMVVSGTLRLPIEYGRGAAEELCRTRQMLRQLTYQPERFIELPAGEDRCEQCSQAASSNPADEPRHSIAVKRRWIATPATRENARDRHHAIQAANEAMQPRVRERREQLLSQIAQLGQQARAEAILSSREYSFCLYPEARLREFLRGD